MAVVVSMLDIDEQQRRDGIAAVTSEMREPLTELIEDNHVLLPWHAHIATARR